MGKFRIKIRSWWASSEYANIIYSTNGIIWHKIQNCEFDIMANRYYMVPLCTHYTNCDSHIKKFTSLDIIKKYEQEEKDRMIRLNNSIEEKDKREKVKREDVYKRLS